MRVLMNMSYCTTLSICGVFNISGLKDAPSFDDALLDALRDFFDTNHGADMAFIRTNSAYSILWNLYGKYSDITTKTIEGTTKDIEVWPITDDLAVRLDPSTRGEVPVIVLELEKTDPQKFNRDDYLITIYFTENNLVLYAINLWDMVRFQHSNGELKILDKCCKIESDDDRAYSVLVTHDVKDRCYNAFNTGTVIFVPSEVYLDNPEQTSVAEEAAAAYEKEQKGM